MAFSSTAVLKVVAVDLRPRVFWTRPVPLFTSTGEAASDGQAHSEDLGMV